MKYKSIREEARLCRQRFRRARSRVGDWVMFCHHGIPFEQLSEPPEERINFILSWKVPNEQAIRLHWFRPLPERLLKKIPERYFEVMSKRDIYWKLRHEYDSALTEYKTVMGALSTELESLIKRHYKGCPWDGKSLI